MVSKKNNWERLNKLMPLMLLPEEGLKHLSQKARFEQHKKGDYLFQQGDGGQENVYLLNGKVALLADGVEVDSVSFGNETARFPLAHQFPRKNSAQCRTRVECVRIDNRLLSGMLAHASNGSHKVEEAAELDAGAGDDWMTQLLQSRVFQQIPAANIQRVMMHMEKVKVEAGGEIIRQGGEGDFFYLINQGRCSITQEPRGGGEVLELVQLGSGASFGEEALLSESPHRSTVTMLTDGILLSLNKEHFIQFVKLPLLKNILYEQALALVEKGAVWLDVRPAEEYEAGHLNGAINLPMNDLRYQPATLAPEHHYLAYCDTGQQSAAAAFLLIERGLNVSVLEGGFHSTPVEVLEGEPQGEERGVAEAPPGDEGELAALKARLAEVDAHAQQFSEQVKSLQEQKSQDDAQQLKGKKVLKLAREKAKEKIRRLEEEKNKVQQQLDGLLQERDQGRDDSEQNQSQLSKKLVDLQAENSKAREDYEREIKMLRGKLGKAEKAVVGVKEGAKKLKQELIGSDERWEKWEADKEEGQEKIAALEGDLSEQQVANDEAKMELERLKMALVEEGGEAAGEYEQQLKLLRQELQEAASGQQKEERESRRLSRKLKKVAGESEVELKALQGEMESLNEALEQADIVYEEAKKQVAALTEEVGRQAVELESLRHDLVQAKEEK